MSGKESAVDRERRLRRAAVTAETRQVLDDGDADRVSDHVADRDADRDADHEADHAAGDDSGAGQRLEQQALWVDLQIRRAIERGEFDELPGAGKPIKGLGGTHDPDWWIKGLIEREQITDVLPPALGLRKEHAQMESRLDREGTDAGVRAILVDFNARVVEARRQLLGGPPVITPTLDIDEQVEAWRLRRRLRRERSRLSPPVASASASPPTRRRRWWRRRSDDDGSVSFG